MDISILQEEELVLLLKKHDESAFRILVERYQGNMYNVCLGFLKNEEDAEDIAQEVFIEAFEAMEHFREQSGLKTWLYRIAVNKSLEQLRKNKRQKRLAWLTSLFGKENLVETNYVNFVHPGVEMENKERAAILLQHIEQLPEKQKVAFTLSKIEGLSYEEIAEVLAVTMSAVESLMVRAKRALQASLKMYYESTRNNE